MRREKGHQAKEKEAELRLPNFMKKMCLKSMLIVVID